MNKKQAIREFSLKTKEKFLQTANNPYLTKLNQQSDKNITSGE